MAMEPKGYEFFEDEGKIEEIRKLKEMLEKGDISYPMVGYTSTNIGPMEAVDEFGRPYGADKPYEFQEGDVVICESGADQWFEDKAIFRGEDKLDTESWAVEREDGQHGAAYNGYWRFPKSDTSYLRLVKPKTPKEPEVVIPEPEWESLDDNLDTNA